ncbi:MULTISPECIES: DUF5823 family protein [unclassified Bacillus cereus group]|uniref:DUF5823 family protein n=1 Tax=unclassified Bacillus cereus group TaxID=2750818 RepID=UPI0022DFEB2C|nr:MULTISPECIES: DUF5823 family protein [unclassified Bacillus cereus group]MDA1532535.1 DUF5823 family protein [Bacillus cereus group sp. TH254-2LC]MDA1544424.1 DUF5823 family protein [Bacillus cereus group sp. TH253LC]MDA1580806.1 DUF5823 family protein [Bacillus cereus group sp. TH228LC]MDA1627422.1 DUF5823 family protein [Bacillus cereus group sp. TH172LC]MDA1830083.1 DUF5823 family protein [Bacillus cereus group sp. BY142LC]
MIEILRTVINFLISLFSGELPIVYYVWIIALFIMQIIQATLSYKLFKKKNNFSTYISEGLLAFIILLFGGILVSKLLAYIIDDPTISMTNVTHYFISLIILTIFVSIGFIKDFLQSSISNKNVALFAILVVSLLSSILSFKFLSPFIAGSFTLSKSFITTLIILVTVSIPLLISLEEKYASEEETENL